MFGYIDDLFSDPKGTLIFILLAFPGRLLAISLHEFAHAWVANRCGDPTAKLLGRLTVNPAKHLDLWGTLMMLLVGFGWAKPVPVNPRNYRNLRRDDLKVSLAGVTMNLIMFVLSTLLLIAVAMLAVGKVPTSAAAAASGGLLRQSYLGEDSILFLGELQYIPIPEMLRLIWSPTIGRQIIAPVLGAVPGYLYQMVAYFSLTNLALLLFNLIPVPPLDGYHVLNDLVLRRRRLFANPRTAQIASMVLLALVFTGVLGQGLGWVETQIFSGIGSVAASALRAMGLIA